MTAASAKRAEDCGTGEQKRDMGFHPSGGEERADDRSDCHDRCQEPVLACSCMKTVTDMV